MGEGSYKREFRFCIDRGGTFTDVYAEVPGEPNCRVIKLLLVDPANYEDAPTEGIRRILEEVTWQKIPRLDKITTYPIEWIRMGTTVATNALLERKGERLALCVTKGFKDLLQIGNQARPKIFDLTIAKPLPLFEEVIEVEERVQLALDGEVESERIVKGVFDELVEVAKTLDEEALKPLLEGLLRKGIMSIGVVFIHSYIYPTHELVVERLAKALGFKQVSLSSTLLIDKNRFLMRIKFKISESKI